MPLQLYLRKQSILSAALLLRVGSCLPNLYLLSKITMWTPWQTKCGGYCVHIWGLRSAPNCPASQTPTSEPETPAVVPSPTVKPTPSPSMFAENSKSYQRKFCNGNQDFDWSILTGSSFHTQQQPNSASFETPESGETPQVCAAPRKRKPENNLMDIFDI